MYRKLVLLILAVLVLLPVTVSASSITGESVIVNISGGNNVVTADEANVTVNVKSRYTDVESEETVIHTDGMVQYIGNMKLNGGIMRNINSFAPEHEIGYIPTWGEVPNLLAHIYRLTRLSTVYTGFFDYRNEEEDSKEGYITTAKNYILDSLIDANVVELSAEDLENMMSTREDKILGKDINVMQDSIIATPKSPGINQLELEKDSSDYSMLEEKDDLEDDNLNDDGTWEFTPFYALDRTYEIAHKRIDDFNVARRYQVISMLYKAGEEYDYEIKAWNSRLLDKQIDIPLTWTPFTQVVDWIGATVDTDRYFVDVYITRSQPSNYLEKAAKDGLIMRLSNYEDITTYIGNLGGEGSSTPDGALLDSLTYLDKGLSYLEFFKILQKYMFLNGEPELNKREQDTLLIAYGSQIPYHLEQEEQDIIKYLLARGIISSDEVIDYSESITINKVKTYLMRMKDAGSRHDFKNITVEYNADLIDRGYALTSISMGSQLKDLSIEFDKAVPDYIDIFVEIVSSSDPRRNTEFLFSDKKTKCTQIEFANWNYVKNQVSYSFVSYVGRKRFGGKEYYHFRVDQASISPNINDATYLFKGKSYVAINSENWSDLPHAVGIPVESLTLGGIYVYDTWAERADSDSQPEYGAYNVYLKFESTFQNTFGSDNYDYVDEEIKGKLGELKGRMVFLSDEAGVTFRFSLTEGLDKYTWGGNKFEALIGKTEEELIEAGITNNPCKAELKMDIDTEEILLKLPNIHTRQEAYRQFIQYFRSSLVGVKNYPAYILDSGNVLVQYSYLKETKILDNMYSYDTEEHGKVYVIEGPDINISVMMNFNNSGNVRAVYGNVVTDFIGDKSPFIIEDRDSGMETDWLIDYRLVRGVSKDNIVTRANNEGLSHLLVKAKDMIDKATQVDINKAYFTESTRLNDLYETISESPSVSHSLRTFNYSVTGDENNRGEVFLLLEATNYLGNYVIYQKRGSFGLKEDYLLQVRPLVDEIDTKLLYKGEGQDYYKNEETAKLFKDSGLTKLADNEWGYSLKLNSDVYAIPKVEAEEEGPIVTDSIDYDNESFPRFSVGPYGFQYRMQEVKDTNFLMKEYLENPEYGDKALDKGSIEYPIPIFYNNRGSNDNKGKYTLESLITNNISYSNYEYVMPIDLTFFKNRPSTNGKENMRIDFEKTSERSTLFTDSIDYITSHAFLKSAATELKTIVPIALVSRYYIKAAQETRKLNELGFGRWGSKSNITNMDKVYLGNMLCVPLYIEEKQDMRVSDSKGKSIFTVLGLDQFTLKGAIDEATNELTEVGVRQIFNSKTTGGIYLWEQGGWTVSFTNGLNDDFWNTAPEVLKASSIDIYDYDYETWEADKKIVSIAMFLDIMRIAILQILPIILFGLLIIIASLSLVKDFRLVQWMADKVFDPIKILSFGMTDVYRAEPKRLWLFVLIFAVVMGLIQAAMNTIFS